MKKEGNNIFVIVRKSLIVELITLKRFFTVVNYIVRSCYLVLILIK